MTAFDFKARDGAPPYSNSAAKSYSLLRKVGYATGGCGKGQAGMPVIRHSTAHSASLTGHTDSRDCRNRENPASSGTVFISASATGFFTGMTGATSTIPNLPVGSPGSG